MMEVKNLTGKYMPSCVDVSFELHKGEIIWCSGTCRKPQDGTLETIFGVAHKASGEILMNGKPVNNKDSSVAIKTVLLSLQRKERYGNISRNEYQF